MRLGDYPRHYRCVVADPPWRPRLGGTLAARADKARPQRFYRTLSLAEIMALDVPAAPRCHLYLWCLAQHVDWAYAVAGAWGFAPVVLMTWRKAGRRGVGRFRCNTEHFLVARKGDRHGQPFGPTDGTCFDWPRGRHSEKPADCFALAERLSVGPRLELFARPTRPGWDGWGDEYPGPPPPLAREVATAPSAADPASPGAV